MGIRHLPAIDGLRAVAVLSVIAYHVGAPAGFVGVDVFFVISGYLITRILMERPPLVEFYARRARRILPAAFLVVSVTLALSMLLLPSSGDVARSAAAAGVFVANLFFQSVTGGYWSDDAASMPLLHLWSLSVEEQFYLAWPLLILFGRKWIGWVFGLSLALYAYLSWANPEAAFYQTPARAWELAAGGLVAVGRVRPLRGGLPVVMLACLVPLPVYVAQPLAVLGATLFVASAHSGHRSVLEARPIVYVGLISYSLYLWHWPLLVLAGESQIGTKLGLMVLAFALSVLTYRYVETPARNLRLPNRRTVMLGVSAGVTLSLVACAVGLRTPEPQPLIAKDRPPTACRYVQADTQFPKCPSEARIAVWGDSMAYSWRPAVERLGPTADYSRDACPPFLDYRNGDGEFEQLCSEFNQKVAESVIGMDTLVVTALWRFGADPERVGGLRRTLDAIAPKVGRVIVIGPSPRMRDKVPRCVQMDKDCAIARSEFDSTARGELAVLRKVASAYPNVSVIDVSDRFCTQDECPPLRDGVPLYWDSHHVSYSVSSKYDLR